MKNADGKVTSTSPPMSASTSRPASRRSNSSQSLRRFSFVYLFLVSSSAVSGSPEGRFQPTTKPENLAPSSIDEYSGRHAGDLFSKSPSSSVSRKVSTAFNRNIPDSVDLDPLPYETSIRKKSTEDSELPVLNLTLATILLSQNLENDVIMGLNSGDNENHSRYGRVLKKSDSVSVNKKHKGLREYMKARVSSEPKTISFDEKLERRVAPDSGTKRLSFLKDLKGFTKNPRRTRTNFNFDSARQRDETFQDIESSAEKVTEGILGRKSSDLDGEILSANTGGKSVKDMLGMIRKWKKSTAIPQSEVSNGIQYRSRNVTDSSTVNSKTGLSSALKNFLKEGVRSAKTSLRVGSLANDSIDNLPDNKTSGIDDPSIQSNSFVSDDKVTTSLPTENHRIESTTFSQITTGIVDLEPINEIHGDTSVRIENTTSLPILTLDDKTVPQRDSPLATTEVTSTKTASTTPRNVLIIRKFKTTEHFETPSPIIEQTENLPVTEALQTTSSFLTRRSVSTTEKLNFRKLPTTFSDETSIDFQTSPQLLNISTTKVSTDFQLITDADGWDQDSTSTPVTPHAGPVVEKEILTVYADTAGITVCLVILCIGLLLFVFAIYYVCSSSKQRDAAQNVQPYSARRFSDS